MTDILLDFSQNNDLRLLAALISQVRAAAGDIPFLLAGATARDLLLGHAQGIRIDRATEDVDLVFHVPDWAAFEQLRKKLLDGEFSEIPRNGIHKLRYRGTLEVDILPFGGVERPDRTIVLPPDNAFTMSMFGFTEALKSSVTIKLPDDVSVQVVSLPALAILKLSAWRERNIREPGKDAYDLRLIIRSYPDLAGERLFESNPYVLGSPADYGGTNPRRTLGVRPA
jgi:predicted nucleotidyltransferase